MKFQITYMDKEMKVLREVEVEADAFEDVLNQVVNEACFEIDGEEVAGISITPDGQY